MQMPIDTRKRRRTDQQHPQLDETPRLVTKRRKISYPKNNKPPPAFWDGLSVIPLTQAALKEFDRRTTEIFRSTSCGSSNRRHQPITRALIAKWKSEHLHKSLSRLSDEEKRFARLGGPDLTDLRGVRDSKYALL